VPVGEIRRIDGEYSSDTQNSPLAARTRPSLSTPDGLTGSCVPAVKSYGVSSRPAMLDSPVIGRPAVVVSGIDCCTRSVEPSTFTRRMAGSNPGTGNVRRLSPSTLTCPFGPRSVTIQYSSGACAG
jgi:hypothetical protein